MMMMGGGAGSEGAFRIQCVCITCVLMIHTIPFNSGLTAGYSVTVVAHIKTFIPKQTFPNYYDISLPSTIGEGGVERRAV